MTWKCWVFFRLFLTLHAMFLQLIYWKICQLIERKCRRLMSLLSFYLFILFFSLTSCRRSSSFYFFFWSMNAFVFSINVSDSYRYPLLLSKRTDIFRSAIALLSIIANFAIVLERWSPTNKNWHKFTVKYCGKNTLDQTA